MKNVTLPKILQPYSCLDLIRLGKDNDGGYLVNKTDVEKTETLLSFGLGEDISFEKDFVENRDCAVYAYDATIGDQHESFFSHKNKIFHENIKETNINDILVQHQSVFLKCDIDGSEYEILYDLISNSNRFTGVAIEFHDLTKYENFNELTNFIAKFELRLVHVHINNYTYINMNNRHYIPDVLELTFSSSRTNTRLDKLISLPHVLDMPNNPNDDEFMILF